jgi:hypothetical protein
MPHSTKIIRMIKSRRMKRVGHTARVGKSNAYKVLEGKPIGKRPLGKPRHRWEDSIRMDIGEIGWGDVDWIHLAENKRPVAGSCEHGNEHSGSIKLWEILE